MSFGNLSARDRWVRMVLGACMLAAAWLLPSGIGRLALEIFGWPPLAAAAVGWDPIYAVFGIDTTRRGGRRREGGCDGEAAPGAEPEAEGGME